MLAVSVIALSDNITKGNTESSLFHGASHRCKTLKKWLQSTF